MASSRSEWALVRVVLAADKDKVPAVVQPPGYVGCGSDKAKCVFCPKSFAALINRVRDHVAGTALGTACPGPTLRDDEDAEAFLGRKASFDAARAACRAKNAALRAEVDAKQQKRALDRATAPHTFVPDGAKLRPLKQAKLTDSSALHSKATEDLARGLFSAGVAPHVLENKLLKRGLLSVAEAGAGWRPPSRKELLGTLLDAEHASVKRGIAEARSTTARVGVVLVGDGATNVNREPILNLLSVQGNRVEFIKAQDCSGKVKDARFIADDVINVINALEDPQSVVAVLMDNATRAAWPLIEAACPWVVCGPCGPHVVDLLLEDVGRLPFFKQLFLKAQTLRVFVRGHGHVLAAYNLVKKTALIIPAGTRFCSSVIGLSNLEANREALVSTFGAPAVLAAMAKVKNDKLEGEHATVGALFAHLQHLVTDMDFWTECEWAKAVMKPIAKLLRFMEQDAPTASKVYQAWYLVQTAIEEMEGLPADLKKDILDCIAYRWDYGYTMIHGAGYVLDPEFRLCEPPEECMDSFYEFVLKCYPEPINNGDQEAYEAAMEQHTAILAECDRQLLEFRRGDGVWGRPAVQLNAKLVSAVDVWDMYGKPPLQRVALRALGASSGAAPAERGHKEMNFIKSKLRNRLDWEKTEKLMYVRINLDILNRDVDYSSICNPVFELEEEDEPEELPSAWREVEEDEGEPAPAPAPAAAISRSKARASALAANKAATQAGAPRAAPPPPQVEREEGRRSVRRPRALDDFE